MLKFPDFDRDFDRDFVVHVDASEGVGAFLAQPVSNNGSSQEVGHGSVLQSPV